MAGSYRHIQEHEKEITELRVQSATLRQLGERSGFSVKQIKNRYYPHTAIAVP